MNELQKQKAVEALEKQKDKEQMQTLAMIFHLGTILELRMGDVVLPFKVLYDIKKQVHDKTFTEVEPNPYYPAPGVTLATSCSQPIIPPNSQMEMTEDYRQKWEKYKRLEEAERMNPDKWAYWYARFLLPYDLRSFSDFDYWGEIPKTEEEKRIVQNMKAVCIEAQRDCREHPERYNLKPIQRLEEHRNIYDVPYGYI